MSLNFSVLKKRLATPRAISNQPSSTNWRCSSSNLGKGFLFEARQKRLTFDTDHYFVDLVFYNRILRCYVLIDLKIGRITHSDLGQMQMYVNYYDRKVKFDDENPTAGIILCKTKNDALVELTLPKDTNVYASRYQVYLPSKEELKRKLVEWSEDTPGIK